MSDRDPYQELLDESRHRDAVDERTRERWLTTRLREDARFVASLTDLVERGVTATVRTDAGVTRRGALVGVGRDHVIVLPDQGPQRYLALSGITDVRPDPASRPDVAAGERDERVDRTLVEVLARAAGDRPRVHVRLRGQAGAVTGQVLGVGQDVVSVRLDGDGGTAYLRAAAIIELAFV